jgi:hypothetical protein
LASIQRAFEIGLLNLVFRLGFSFGLPFHIRGEVRAAPLQRDDVIDNHILAGSGAGMRFFEFPNRSRIPRNLALTVAGA